MLSTFMIARPPAIGLYVHLACGHPWRRKRSHDEGGSDNRTFSILHVRFMDRRRREMQLYTDDWRKDLRI
jgi:hypothetical protein